MTLRIHVAPHPDALVAMLCERLIAEPLDPFTPEIVAVPTRGIERWLTQRIGLDLPAVPGGISAHVEFPSPRDLVRWIVTGVPALGASLAAWEGASLQTVVMACIDDDLGETQNLAAAQPERVAQMQALLEKLITDGRSTPGAPQKNDVEVKRYPAKAKKGK